jgi:plasmid segregation protein ParM
MKAQVFAVDVGYGNTKFAHRAINRNINTGMFPSLAPYSAVRSVSASGGTAFTTRDVTHVTVNGTGYIVGPDVPLNAAYGKTGRVLTDDYARTNNYAALLAGAIYRSGFDHIERLVLGLPVHTIHKFAPDLKNRFTGKHQFGQGIIHIDHVSVIPQPLGALTYAIALRSEINADKRDHLIVDIGYFTSDWVYFAGHMIDDSRSDGMAGGASQVIKRIADNIGHDVGDSVYDLERIDAAIREGTPFHFYNREIDVAPYVREAQALTLASMQHIKDRVGPIEGVRSIILTGGGASLYESALRDTFPTTTVELLENPCQANAIGFLLFGESAPIVV